MTEPIPSPQLNNRDPESTRINGLGTGIGASLSAFVPSAEREIFRRLFKVTRQSAAA